MAVQWEITSFSISAHDTVLFANGNMQVANNITITAINPINNDSYNLTTTDLGKIELCDYYTNDKLTGGWTYTATENEFGHSMPSTLSSTDDAAPSDTTDVVHETVEPKAGQGKKYWVSTTKLETKVIAARIPQPNGKVVSTNSREFDSSVSIRGTEPVNYRLSNVEWWREDTSSNDGWMDQDNYYLRSKRYNFKKVNRSGYRNDSYAIVGMRNSTAYHRAPAYHFMWDMGPKTTVTAGITHYENGTPHPFAAISSRTITIRQYANALCLTRCRPILAPSDVWDLSWWFSPTFRIFDIYGNFGDFSVASNEYNTISIKERNVFANDTESAYNIFHGEGNEEATKVEVYVNVNQGAKVTIPVTQFPEGEPSDNNLAAA